MKYGILFLILIVVSSFSLVHAETFGYGRTETIPINYSLIPTVNSSDYWDGLSSPSDISHPLLDNLEWSVAGHTIDENIDMNGYTFTELENVIINDGSYLGSWGTNLKIANPLIPIGALDLGTTAYPWEDLYLSENVYGGGTGYFGGSNTAWFGSDGRSALAGQLVSEDYSINFINRDASPVYTMSSTDGTSTVMLNTIGAAIDVEGNVVRLANSSLVIADETLTSLWEIGTDESNLTIDRLSGTGIVKLDTNFETTENITADYYFGDGSQLTGISGGDGGWLPNNASEDNNYTTDGNVSANEFNINGTTDHKISGSADNLRIANLNEDKNIIFSINDQSTQRDFMTIDADKTSLSLNAGTRNFGFGDSGIIDVTATASGIGDTFYAMWFRLTAEEDGNTIGILNDHSINHVDYDANSGLYGVTNTLSIDTIQTNKVWSIYGTSNTFDMGDPTGGTTKGYGGYTSFSDMTIINPAGAIGSDLDLYGNYLKRGTLVSLGASGTPTLDSYGIYLTGWGVDAVDYSSATWTNNLASIYSDGGDWILEADDTNICLGAGGCTDFNISFDGTDPKFDYGEGVAWFSDNISAKNFITRTSVFDKSRGNALDLIKDADELTDENGKIIHSNFAGYTTYPVTDRDRPEIEITLKQQVYDIETYNQIKDYIDETILQQNKTHVTVEYEIEKTIYPHTKLEEGVSLGGEIDVLRQAVYDLNKKFELADEENKLMKASLCKLGEAQWC